MGVQQRWVRYISLRLVIAHVLTVLCITVSSVKPENKLFCVADSAIRSVI